MILKQPQFTKVCYALGAFKNISFNSQNNLTKYVLLSPLQRKLKLNKIKTFAQGLLPNR